MLQKKRKPRHCLIPAQASSAPAAIAGLAWSPQRQGGRIFSQNETFGATWFRDQSKAAAEAGAALCSCLELTKEPLFLKNTQSGTWEDQKGARLLQFPALGVSGSGSSQVESEFPTCGAGRRQVERAGSSHRPPGGLTCDLRVLMHVPV